MRKIADSLIGLLQDHPDLSFCFSHGLLNLTATAAFLKPLLEARTKKEITTSSIVMALSRLTKKNQVKSKRVQLRAGTISVYSDLVVFTFDKTPQTHAQVFALYSKLVKRRAYATVTEGLTQITIIFELKYLQEIEQSINQRPAFKKTNIGGLSVMFSEDYLEIPGFLSKLLEQLSTQKINVVELASTSTEIIFYLEASDIHLAFDTLYRRFVQRSSP